MKDFRLLSFKMAIASTISFILASFLGLEFAISSAVVAILSIQETKRKTLNVAKKRLIAATLGILISAILYMIIGHNLLSFFIFILIFSYIALRMNVEEGLTVTVVLSTHLYLSDISLLWIINELLILFIGIFIATVTNLFMPSLEDSFNKYKISLEESYKYILEYMSNSLLTQTVNVREEKLFTEASNNLNIMKDIAYKISENRLIQNDDYYMSYANMRLNQYNTLVRIRRHFEKFYISYEQTEIIASFTEKISNNIGEKNNPINLINELASIRELMKEMDLPKSRDEFENRALLYQYLNDLEEFLTIKYVFINSIRENN